MLIRFSVVFTAAFLSFQSYNAWANDEPTELLLNPLEPGADIHQGKWRMRETYIKPALDLEPKLGLRALTFGGNSEIKGGKGDFALVKEVPGKVQQITLQAHLTEDANVRTLGIQVRDSEGEVFIEHVPADWTGWRLLEFNLDEANYKQAYPQVEKNEVIDFPIKGIHFSWFSNQVGPTHLTVDAMKAKTILEENPDQIFGIDLTSSGEVQLGEKPAASLFVTNYGDEEKELTVNYSFQVNNQFHSAPLPDPVHGSNLAAGKPAWIVYDGEKQEAIESNDDKKWTGIEIPYQKAHYTKVSHIIDLGEVRPIQHLRWLAGNANAAWIVNVLTSLDGENYEPVKELQGVNEHKRWGMNEFPDFAPVKARWLKFDHLTDGEKKNRIALPVEVLLYDGVADEPVEIPDVGETLEEGTLTVKVPGKSFVFQPLELKPVADGGVYYWGFDLQADGFRELIGRNIFTALTYDPKLQGKDARIAINSSRIELVKELQTLGIPWVRFENGKWPFVSTGPDSYQFNPGAKPWNLNFDQIFGAYKEHGIDVLSYMFLIPEWASQPGPNVVDRVKLAQVPKDLKDYGEFCFQMAARYGSKKHPPEVLKTEDKLSGLNLVQAYNIYNEPNLNASYDAVRGGWAAPMEVFYEMMRHGVEGVRRADPDAIVTGPSLAGMTVRVVDPLRTYTYEDGKHPIDLIDVICVHFYSGHEPPETAQTDGNSRVKTDQTFPENMRELSAWRDKYAPGKPIWMTETGYDSAGEFGTNEVIQAARLPRQIMLALAYGVEKVFVYREKGSSPRRHAAAGLMRNDHSFKPSWYTYGTVLRQFRHVKGGAIRLPYSEDENVWLMLWEDKGQPLITAWTVNGEATLQADFGPCTLVSAFGRESKIKETKGLKLSQFPQYLKGFSDQKHIVKWKEKYEKFAKAEKERLEKISKQNRYLFDFGVEEHIGEYFRDGHKTSFELVKEDTLWDSDKGFGFDQAARKTRDRKWLGSRYADRDSVKVGEEIFTFKAQPGDYKLAFMAEPFQRDPVELSISGGSEQLSVEVKRGDIKKGELVYEVDFSVSEPDSTVEFRLEEGSMNLYWIAMTEVAKKE